MEGLSRIIEQVSREKGIPVDSLRETIEQAMVAAARKVYGQLKDIEAQYNAEIDTIELFEFRTVVEEVEEPDTEITLEDARLMDPGAMVGDELGQKMVLEDFGRIAAQTAKQVIIQRVRDSEREKIYDAFVERVGELITGIVRRFEKGAIIVDLGKAEAVIPSREQVRTETYRQGDRIQAYILEVARNARGPQIVLSRTHPGLLVKLFEMEVPEIYENIVTIEAAVREPGHRAKIAVSSRDRDVDPVGACVGMRGSRVQAVVQELRGEKIDIIPFSIDPARFVCSAISPAVVTKVILDEDTRTMELIVPDDMLSLAIGRRGQNVRLAAQLTGWRIDIHSETKLKDMNSEARTQLARIEGLNEDHREILIRYGYRTVQDVADSETDDLVETLGIDEARAEKAIDFADEILTEEMRQKIAHDEENARRRADGLPTMEEEEALKLAAEEDAEIARLSALVQEQEAAQAIREATALAAAPPPVAEEPVAEALVADEAPDAPLAAAEPVAVEAPAPTEG
jgi:transcription termination/antitermination protein NusA